METRFSGGRNKTQSRIAAPKEYLIYREFARLDANSLLAVNFIFASLEFLSRKFNHKKQIIENR
jgi:hypothetical protein